MPENSTNVFIVKNSCRCIAYLSMLLTSGYPLCAAESASDYSNLEQSPVQVTPPSRITRGVTRGPTADPVRRYDRTRGVVTVEEVDGAKKDLPFVVIPILFKVNSDQLLDSTSEGNVRVLADKLKESSLSSGHFVIEGHTSTEGRQEYNDALSERRAERIFALLTRQFNVPPAMLSTQGFGPRHPEVLPETSEHDRERNRRVLVVRDR